MSFDEIYHALLDDLNCITSVEAAYLCKDVTKEEIYDTLRSLPHGKSPGPDGFNVEFYKFFWDDIGDQLVSAIKYFLDSASMPKS